MPNFIVGYKLDQKIQALWVQDNFDQKNLKNGLSRLAYKNSKFD